MVNLPPLPNRTILTPAKHTVWGYTLEQMQADRKQVWEAALEEAAQAQPDDENSVKYWKAYSKSQNHSYDLLRLEVKKLRAAKTAQVLPTPAFMPSELLPNAGGVLGALYTADQMQACREAALEEAAKAIKEPIGYDNYTAMHQAAIKIRGLK